MTQLIHFDFCPRSRAIRIALAELGHEAELVPEAPWSWRPELLALNPSGELPILKLPGGSIVSGAYAICELLDEMQLAQTSDANGLFPGDLLDRAEARRLTDWFLHKLDREVSIDLLDAKIASRFDPARGQAPAADTLRAVRHNLRYHMKYIDHLALERDWLAGQRLSMADMAAAGHISILDYFGEIDWEQHPAAKSWYVRLKSRPSFRALLADRLPGMSPHKTYADLDF